MISTGENNSEGVSVTAGNLPDSLSPGGRTLPRAGRKGQHLNCALGGESSKEGPYFCPPHRTVPGQSVGTGVEL